VPLIAMVIAFTLLFITLHVAAMRNEIMRRRIRTMLMMQAETAG
jgi:heme exporter protein C